MEIKNINLEDGYQEITLDSGDEITIQYPRCGDSVEHYNDIEIDDELMSQLCIDSLDVIYEKFEEYALNKHTEYNKYTLSAVCLYGSFEKVIESTANCLLDEDGEAKKELGGTSDLYIVHDGEDILALYEKSCYASYYGVSNLLEDYSHNRNYDMEKIKKMIQKS